MSYSQKFIFIGLLILQYHWDNYRLWHGGRQEMKSGSCNLLSIRFPFRLDHVKISGVWDSHIIAKTGCVLLVKKANKNPENWFHKIPLKILQNLLRCQPVSRARTFIMISLPWCYQRKNPKRPLELVLVHFENHLSGRF